MKPGTKLGGRYQLTSRIGRGPRSQVWEALDETLDRRVAVRILDLNDAPQRAARSEFSAIAYTGAGLNHPSIVAVYDTGEHQGVPFLVMERMAGETLEKKLAAGDLDVPHAAALALSGCAALRFAHGRGVAHGRITPSNLLLDGAGKWKLSGFSITGASDQDRSADLSAFGSVLYLALTRRRPESSAPGPPVPPSVYRAEIPQAFEELVLKAIDHGFSDAEQMHLAQQGAALAEPETIPEAAGRARVAEALPSFVRSEGRWLARLAVLIVAVAAVTFLALNLAGRRLNQIFGPPTAQAIEIAAASIYDPVEAGGNGRENDDLAKLAIDGDPDTSWHTEWYRTAPLGGAKPGLGLVIDLGSAAQLTAIEVLSPAGGWEGSIRTSGDGIAWSSPASASTVEETHEFEVRARSRWWMIWITRLVQTPGVGSPELPYSVGISEIHAFGSQVR